MSAKAKRPPSHASRPTSQGTTASEEHSRKERQNWWSTDVNDSIHLNFEQDLTKTVASHQPFEHDYGTICRTNGIFKCSFIKISTDETGKTKLHLANTAIDLANWEAMLMASLSSGVTGIFFHGLSLTKRHLNALFLAAPKLDHLTELNMDYCLERDDETLFNEALPTIFNSSIAHISLRGNKLTDAFAKTASTLISANIYLSSLNLSDNLLTDAGATSLFESLKLNVNLKYISFRGNACHGSCLPQLLSLIAGQSLSAAENTSLKSIVGLVAARNKKSKELVKKGQAKEADAVEIVAPDGRVFKMGTENYIANRSICEVDFSWSNVDCEQLVAAAEAMLLQPSFTICTGQYALTIVVRGVEVSPTRADALRNITRSCRGSLKFDF